MKICFIGPSGVGKSTAAKHLAQTHQFVPIALASPLYEMQAMIRFHIGLASGGQDGLLLQALAEQVNRIDPTYLLARFRAATHLCWADNIVNADCRLHNARALRDMGFVFVRINGPARQRPEDASAADPAHHLEQWDTFLPDFTIYNTSTMQHLHNQLDILLEELCG